MTTNKGDDTSRPGGNLLTSMKGNMDLTIKFLTGHNCLCQFTPLSDAILPAQLYQNIFVRSKSFLKVFKVIGNVMQVFSMAKKYTQQEIFLNNKTFPVL